MYSVFDVFCIYNCEINIKYLVCFYIKDLIIFFLFVGIGGNYYSGFYLELFFFKSLKWYFFLMDKG